MKFNYQNHFESQIKHVISYVHVYRYVLTGELLLITLSLSLRTSCIVEDDSPNYAWAKKLLTTTRSALLPLLSFDFSSLSSTKITCTCTVAK